MKGQRRTGWGRTLRWSAGFFFLLPFCCFLDQGRAQAPAALPGSTVLVYTWQTAFRLPVKIEDAERARLGEIRLFVRNGPAAPWVCQEVAPPGQREFLFRAPQDGEY